MTAEEIARRGTADFDPSFEALKDAVGAACGRETEWEAKVVAGIGAVIEFSVEDMAAARALTVCAGALATNGDDPEGQVFGYFTGLLEDVAPSEMLFPISSAEGIVETGATMIRGHLLAGRAESLPALGPELVYLTLMPYLGLGGARQWAAGLKLPVDP